MSAVDCEDQCPPAKKLKVDSDNASVALTSDSSSTNGVTPKPHSKFDEKTIDHEYFDSYADVEVHRTMIEDQARTDAYHKAIMQTPSFVKDKVVCDVGCGSGILSMFCAQAGAKKVYAIDASKIAKQAKIVIAANGFDQTITVLEGKAEDVELPEKVDVVVSEWMGHMLLYETMLPSVLHVRDKWLKPGGLMFPDRAVMKAAMAETSWLMKYEEETYDFWISLHPMYGLEMTSLADYSVKRYKELAHLWVMPQKDLTSLPSTILDLDLNTITAKELEVIKCKFNVKSMGKSRLNCLVIWFDVMFPGDIVLSTSPHEEDTHWQHTVLPLPDTVTEQDTEMVAEMVIAQHMKRSLNIQLDYTVGKDKPVSRKYRLDENFSEID